MPISISALKAMAAAGATVDMIISVVEAEHAVDETRAADRRKRDRLRKRDERASQPSGGQRVTPQDTADTTQVVGNPPPSPPTSRGGETAATSPAGRPAPARKRKVSPHPSKETLPLLEEIPLEVATEEASKIPVAAARARAGGGSAGCRLPDDWMPSETDLAFGRKLLGDARAQAEIDKFRDYWHARAGPNAIKRSWPATWRTWCRKAAEDEIGNGNNRTSNRGGGGQGSRGRGFAAYAVNQARSAGET